MTNAENLRSASIARQIKTAIDSLTGILKGNYDGQGEVDARPVFSTIDNNKVCNKTAGAFKIIKDLRKLKTTRRTVIEDNESNLLRERSAIPNRWKEYC